ncbi:MAG: hypothetical protein VW875_10675 [Planctomycetaceae bacterium]
MNFHLWFIVFLIPSLQAGCVLPTFEHAASTVEQAEQDEDLYGKWFPLKVNEDGTVEKEDESLLIGRDPENHQWTLAGATQLNENDELEHEKRRFLATQIGDDNYLSVLLTEEESKENAGRFMLGKYNFDTNTNRLGIRWVNPTKLKEVIQLGLLLGTITEEPTTRNAKQELKLKAVHVESTTDELRIFLKQHPDMLFEKQPISYLQRERSKN